MSSPAATTSFSVDGDVAVVTGGGTGIGRAIALEFAKAGVDIAICGRRLDVLEATAKEIEALGRRALAVPADVSRKSDIEHLFERVRDELGDVDILVNNAANGGPGPSLLDSDEERWDEIIDTNLKSVYLCCRAVGQSMMERKRGNIINISSIDGIMPSGSCRIYGISKAAMNFLTRGLALDMAPHNVRVNGIAPGATRTDLLAADVGTDEESWDALAQLIPLRRVARPLDIATAAVFLASDAGNYVVGQTLVVDAGLYCGPAPVSFVPTDLGKRG